MTSVVDLVINLSSDGIGRVGIDGEIEGKASGEGSKSGGVNVIISSVEKRVIRYRDRRSGQFMDWYSNARRSGMGCSKEGWSGIGLALSHQSGSGSRTGTIRQTLMQFVGLS